MTIADTWTLLQPIAILSPSRLLSQVDDPPEIGEKGTMSEKAGAVVVQMVGKICLGGV